MTQINNQESKHLDVVKQLLNGQMNLKAFLQKQTFREWKHAGASQKYWLINPIVNKIKPVS